VTGRGAACHVCHPATGNHNHARQQDPLSLTDEVSVEVHAGHERLATVKGEFDLTDPLFRGVRGDSLQKGRCSGMRHRVRLGDITAITHVVHVAILAVEVASTRHLQYVRIDGNTCILLLTISAAGCVLASPRLNPHYPRHYSSMNTEASMMMCLL